MTTNMNKKTSRAERRRNETRSKLLDATKLLVYEVGYANLSVRAITERADLGYGTFYVYFSDKDDIVWQAALPNMQAVIEEVNTNAETLPPSQRELYAWYVMFYRAELQRELMLSLFGRNGSPTLLSLYHDFLAKLYATGVDGLYRMPPNVPAEILAQFAAAAVIRLMVWWLEEQPDYTAKEMAAMLFELLYGEAAPELPELVGEM